MKSDLISLAVLDIVSKGKGRYNVPTGTKQVKALEMQIRGFFWLIIKNEKILKPKLVYLRYSFRTVSLAIAEKTGMGGREAHT